MATSMSWSWSKVILEQFCFMILFLQCWTLPFDGIEKYADEYILPELPYEFKDLEPYIDEATVKVHYTGHHAAYTRKLNVAMKQWRADPNPEAVDLCRSSVLQILRHIDSVPDTYRDAIRNNGGGFVNHNIYWSVITPNPSNKERMPDSDILDDIKASFGDYTTFRTAFTQEATNLFGSGYVWLSREPSDRQLVITTSSNQDSPISEGLHPILVIDVWEHAYYLKHQNKRPNHISDWWKLVDWGAVSELDRWWTFGSHDEL